MTIIETSGNYTAIDTETTGLNPETCDIIEIGAVRFRNFEPDGEFSVLVRPKGVIPEFITKLTGISEDMTSDKTYIEDVLPEFEKFIGDDPVAGHCLPFDLGFLKAAGLDIRNNGNEVIDTLEMSRKLVKGPDKIWSEEKKRYVSDMNSFYIVPDHKLSTMCSYFKIPLETAHRAVNDARVAGYLYKELLKLS